MSDHENFRGIPPDSEEAWQRIHLTQHEWCATRASLMEVAAFWPDAGPTLRAIVTVVKFSAIAVKLWPWALALGAALAILTHYVEQMP